MSGPTLRIATRRSRLALWQAEHVAERLAQAHPGLHTELVPMSTRGDKILDRSLAKVGGKGLFIKELEHALLDGRADIAVHSMKDMPAEITPGLHIATVLERASPLDAFVSRAFGALDELPQGARVGTSSLRRAAQLLARRSDFQIVPLRGNVETRLGKLDDDSCDAVILAAAGLTRLGLGSRITATLDPEVCLPAIGQGIIGIECRDHDEQSTGLLRPLHDEESWCAIRAERALGATLGGSCQSPIAGFATYTNGKLRLQARVLSPDGRQCIAGQQDVDPGAPDIAGNRLADALLERGARSILDAAAAQ